MDSSALPHRVVSREEVDALLGFAPAQGAAPDAARDGAVLTPGQRLDLELELPAPPSRARAGWRTAARPIDAWPEAKLRPAAVAVWLRRPTQGRAVEWSGIDFWPAYADVLSNVVLNLLFLVGTLTLGLVVLNQEVVGFQKRLAALMSQEVPAPRRAVQAAPAPAPTTAAAPKAALPPAEAASSAASVRLAPSTAAAPAAAAPAAAQEASPRPLREFAMRNESVAPSGGPAGGGGVATAEQRRIAESAAQTLVGGRHAATLVFDLRETRWPRSRPVVGAEHLGPDDRRALVAFAPVGNRRLMADAFSRLTSVREAMVASGVPASRIDLRIAPVPPELENDDSVSGSVFVINLGGS